MIAREISTSLVCIYEAQHVCSRLIYNNSIYVDINYNNINVKEFKSSSVTVLYVNPFSISLICHIRCNAETLRFLNKTITTRSYSSMNHEP